ncbi:MULTISPECIES: DNA polymerase III subunit gamma/tau [unclassified Spirosoma]|uniref:DNA polymerase III subunit gamma/tau n=1 Tax=unclassified Spirosoma TaxID=2621999 RepID=UPI00096764A7|nr:MULTISPECIES: DNA polymerase III subunit gamma/tau [unclassified Spirosoma]MBN8826287.1 DNA polymerase III subunit gamma/tau [Spirosoma sp.]OJW75187.1 MAG: DNA polymerase III, subunit gamma and tau [Spirosoma sp. 48-14]
MENFVVSARKYRPATFDTVVGQEHITTTLKNAIKTNHLASAFLFCGPRGVGKTTCARILAKTINCQNLTPEGEACDTCDSCVSFTQNASFNIHELDAASNNSVEDIRNLIDQVRYPPQSGKYKIYIIDEVHMLSSAAFNAFLKTLEEPPSYAIFILATTEKHKILPTILSRCQIFDFNRIQPGHISAHLAKIASKENITAESEALDLIAQKADGGLRDALSMFDLNVTFAADRVIRYKEVLDNLHILDYDYYFKLTDLLLAGNLPQSLLTVDEILRKGFDGHQFVVGFCRHFRDLLVCKDPATVQLLQVTENVRRQYLDQAARAPMSFLLSALSLGGQCDMNYKQAKDQRLHIELWLMKLANLRNALNWDSMPELPLNGTHNGDATSLVQSGAEKKNGEPNPSQSAASSSDTSTSPASQPLTTHPITSEPVNGYQSGPSINGNGSSVVEKAPANGHTAPVTGTVTVEAQTPVASKPQYAPPARPASSRLRSTVSLTAGPASTATDTEEIATVRAPTRPDKPFNFDELRDQWATFARLRRQQNDITSEQVVLNRDLVLDGTTIRITLDNTLQVDFLTELKPELLGYLRRELQNSQIQIEHQVVIQEVKKMIYSSQDKYNYMAEKNPALHELRKVLNLEVDY